MTQQPEGSERPHVGTFEALRYRHYRLLWIGDLCAAAAQWMQQTALSWVVYDLTGSGGILGAMNLMRTFPTLFLSPVAGVASDRLPRNRIIGVSQAAMVVLTVLLALDIAAGSLRVWHLFAFSFFAAAAQAFYIPARQTFVFELVPRHVIPNAVALSWLAFSLSRSIGPALGGAMIVAVGPSKNFLLQAVAFSGVIVAVLFIRVVRAERPAGQKSFIAGLKEGYGFAFFDPRARILVSMSLIAPLFIIPLHGALLPIFAKHVFHGDASTLGILAGSIGFGGLFGGVLTAYLSRVDRRVLLGLGALLIFSGCEVVFSIVAGYTGSLWLAIPFLVIAGTAESVYATTSMTVLQLLAPEHLRGSIASVLQLGFLAMPIGALVAGVSADMFGAPVVGTAITLIAFSLGLAILVGSPAMRRLRLSEIQPSGGPAA